MPLFFWTPKDFNAIMEMLTKILEQTQRNEDKLNQLLKREKQVMAALDDLQEQVRQNTDLEQSAVTLIQGIATQLQDAIKNNDQAALQQLSQQLRSSATALGQAIAANTPSEGGGGGGGEPQPQQARRR